MGRFFNLLNVWENAIYTSGGFCGDDLVEDTDIVSYHEGMPRTGNNPCSNSGYKLTTEENFMSSTNLRTLFTYGQKVRMRASLELPNRKSLVNSYTDEIESCIFNKLNTNTFSTNTFKTLEVGKEGYIYAGTDRQGLYQFNGSIWVRYTLLTNNNISDIKTDKNGGIWIAQYGNTGVQAIDGGVDYLPDGFNTAPQYYTPSSGLPTKNCRAIYIDTTSSFPNPTIWTANMTQQILEPDGNFSRKVGAIGFGLVNNGFWSVTEGIDKNTETGTGVQTLGGGDGEVWAFVQGNYEGKNQILVYNSLNRSLKKSYDISHIGNSFPANFLVKSIYIDVLAKKKSTLERRWLGVSHGGLLVFEKQENQSDGSWLYFNHTNFPTKFPLGAVINNNSITSDESGYIYIGTNQGLVVFTGGEVSDPSNYQRFTTDDGLPSNNVLDIVAQNYNGKLVIGTDQGIVFWDKSRIKKSSQIKCDIVRITEDFNQSNYSLPRESTIHHYFKIKNNVSGEPLKNYSIQYSISNKPEKLLYSLPSDAHGLVDINLNVGGDNIETSSDDNIPAGSSNVQVTFKNIVDENFLSANLVNNYFNTAFSVTVVDKIEPDEEEFSAGINFEAILRIGGEFKFKVPGFEGKAGGLSSGIGYTYSPSVNIVPNKINPDLWQVKFSSPLGLKLHEDATVGQEITVATLKVGASAGVEVEIPLADIEENTHFLDMKESSDRFFLGGRLIAQSSGVSPPLLLFSTLLTNLIDEIRKPKSITEGKTFGIQSNLSFSIGLLGQEKEGGRNALGFEIEPGLFSANYELSEEKNDDETKIENMSLSASVLDNLGVEILGTETQKQEIFPIVRNEDPNIFSLDLSRTLNKFGFVDKANVSMKNKQIFGINSNLYGYGLEYNNQLSFNYNAIDKIGNIKKNFVSKFFKWGDFFQAPTTLLGKSVHNQIFEYFNKTSELGLNLESNDVELVTDREITNKLSLSFPFALQAVVGVSFSIAFEECATNKYPLTKYQYSSEFDKLLKTVDYPKIESNLILPTKRPFSIFVSNLVDEINNLSTDVINGGRERVNNALKFLYNLALFNTGNPITLSNLVNGTIKRLNLDGTTFVNTKGTSKTNSTPSTFTFNIPGGNTAFNTGDEILFKYFYPENQLSAATLSDTFKLVTDVFFLNARNGTTELTTAPNGNFTVTTQFSTYELELAGLPLTLTPKVLFQPIGSNTWEIIGDVNQTFNFNRLGIFAIGVSLQEDFIPPTITVTPPISFVDGQNFQFSISDNLSGIDWSKTYFICNNTLVPYQRVGTSNLVNIPIASLHISGSPLPETFSIQISTIDLAYNKKSFSNTYPCPKNIKLLKISGLESLQPINKHQALETIEVSGSSIIPPSIELKAGKSVILSPGFNTDNSGGYFKAEIGGCNSSNIPTQPANFAVSSAIVCKGQTGVVYTIPNEAGVTYNWSYSGIGATIVGTSNSITIDFASNATSGNLVVTATNSAGTSPARVLSIITNSPTAPPSTVAKSIGIGTSTNLSVTGCSTYKWYNQAINGTLLFTGNTFVTPTLNTNTTYYVACSDSPCPETTRTPLLVSVGAVPTQPSSIVGGGVACQGRSGLTYLVPAVSGATSYTWTYSGTGVTFVGGINNTRTVTLDFSYSATSGVLSVTANNAYGSSIAQTMAISASLAPNAPTALGQTISSGNSANLTATGCSIYKWYSQATGGTASTGQNFTTPTLNSTTTYYVACNNGTSCESPRVAVTVTIP